MISPGVDMPLTIKLPPQTEVRLEEKARAAGLDVGTYAERVLELEARRPSLEELSGPIQDAFQRSKMTEDQLADMLVKAKKEMRVARRSRSSS
jgi:hypothetical protein